MKVPVHVKRSFDIVVTHMRLSPEDIAECKAEFEADPLEWGEFYVRAAAIIQAASGSTTRDVVNE